MHFKLKNTALNVLITVAKICEKVLMLNMALATNVKVENFQSMTKQLLTSISVEMRIYQPSKVIFTSA